MCCAHGKCLNSVALVWLPDTSGGGRGNKTEDVFIGTGIVKSKDVFLCSRVIHLVGVSALRSSRFDRNHPEPRGGARTSEDV